MVNHRVNDMAKATHKPPARVRYEQSHPTISFRLSRDVYNLLQQRLEDLGVSAADFIKESLGLVHTDIGELKQAAWGEGYDQGIEDCEIWYYCAVCGKRIDMSPNSDSHKAMIGYMKEHRWGHVSCHGE